VIAHTALAACCDDPGRHRRGDWHSSPKE
jgi:hypothetical protein